MRQLWVGGTSLSASHGERSATVGAAETQDSPGQGRLPRTKTDRAAGQARYRFELSASDDPITGRRDGGHVFSSDCFARSDDGSAHAGRGYAAKIAERQVRVADDLRDSARSAAAGSRGREYFAGVRALRDGLVPVFHAPAGRAPRELLVCFAEFAGGKRRGALKDVLQKPQRRPPRNFAEKGRTTDSRLQNGGNPTQSVTSKSTE